MQPQTTNQHTVSNAVSNGSRLSWRTIWIAAGVLLIAGCSQSGSGGEPGQQPQQPQQPQSAYVEG